MTAAAARMSDMRGGIALFVVVDTATQVAFKYASDAVGAGAFDIAWITRAIGTPVLWIAIALYGLTFILWMLILARLDLSRAFPLSALTYITVPAAGMLLFGERLTMPQTLGIALIISGVLLIGKEKRP